jgi:hypothetical protein
VQWQTINRVCGDLAVSRWEPQRAFCLCHALGFRFIFLFFLASLSSFESRALACALFISFSCACSLIRSLGDPDFKGFSPDSHAQPPDEFIFAFPPNHPRTFTADLVLATPDTARHALRAGDEFLVSARALREREIRKASDNEEGGGVRLATPSAVPLF